MYIIIVHICVQTYESRLQVASLLSGLCRGEAAKRIRETGGWGIFIIGISLRMGKNKRSNDGNRYSRNQ